MTYSGEEIKDIISKVKIEIKKNIVGQEEVISKVLIAMVSGGNILLEGVPGLGKTELVKAIGKVFDLDFSRIQFTPDLMPQDVIGSNVIVKNDNDLSFKFQKGPIFSNLLLADEINRATPKTQSAMLQAMQEKEITSGNETFRLEEPFFVLATQNPIEMEGTYPLPEAQMDRFMFKLQVKFPSLSELKEIVNITTKEDNIELNKIMHGKSIVELREYSKEIAISDSVLNYAMKLISSTHPDKDESTEMVKKYIRYGSSPRGAQAIIRAARVNAMFEGRLNVSYKDIKYVAYDVLRHRMHMNFEALSENIAVDSIIDDIFTGLDNDLSSEVSR